MCLLVPVSVHRVLILKLQISFAIPHPRLRFANGHVGVSKERRDKGQLFRNQAFMQHVQHTWFIL